MHNPLKVGKIQMKRRAFLKMAAAGVPAFNMGTLIAEPFPGSGAVFAKPSSRRPVPSERVSLGVIGCCTQAHANVPTFLQDSRVRIVTVCDPVLSAGGYSYNCKA